MTSRQSPGSRPRRGRSAGSRQGMRPSRGVTARAGASGALSVGSGIGLLATSGWLITRASERPPVLELCVAIGLVQAFALGRGVFRYLQRLSVHDASLEMLGRLRLRLFDALEPLVPGGPKVAAGASGAGGGSGAWLNGFVADSDAVAQGFARRSTVAVHVGASILLGGALAYVLEPDAGLVLVAGALVLVAAALATGLAGREAAEREADARARLAGAVMETVRAARELSTYGRADLLERRLGEVGRSAAEAARRRSVVLAAGRALVTLVSGGTLVVVVLTGLCAERAGRISGVTLSALAFAALAVLDHCSTLPSALADAHAASAARRRISALEQLEPPVVEPGPSRAARLPGGGPIGARLDRVEVGYGEEPEPLLGGLTLEVAPGRRVGLVGPSGSGKTTAVHALLHFLECRRGQASVGGVDVRELDRGEIARHVGWLAEDVHVFAATVRDNLRLGRRDATDADCTRVLARVGLSSWLDSLPEGLGTVVGSGGRQLSAGERQRLAMARLLLVGCRVLLLDEPTAHLERASSDALLGELIEAAGPRSVLVVSHEPGIGRLVDDVVTLGGGPAPSAPSGPSPLGAA